MASKSDREAVTKLMGEYLLKGYTMLEAACDKFCVCVSAFVVRAAFELTNSLLLTVSLDATPRRRIILCLLPRCD